MIRTQIQLDDATHRRLKELAAHRRVSISQLVRDSVDHLLADAAAERHWQRLRRAVGACRDRDGARDVAERHDAYLDAAYRDD